MKTISMIFIIVVTIVMSGCASGPLGRGYDEYGNRIQSASSRQAEREESERREEQKNKEIKEEADAYREKYGQFREILSKKLETTKSLTYDEWCALLWPADTIFLKKGDNWDRNSVATRQDKVLEILGAPKLRRSHLLGTVAVEVWFYDNYKILDELTKEEVPLQMLFQLRTTENPYFFLHHIYPN
ncbi:MAG: hypothetical protein HY298_19450 [Verrucomicrobia bacterium]|nr:hypothetical protein [Verrucomicrobiota bacterium]